MLFHGGFFIVVVVLLMELLFFQFLEVMATIVCYEKSSCHINRPVRHSLIAKKENFIYYIYCMRSKEMVYIFFKKWSGVAHAMHSKQIECYYYQKPLTVLHYYMSHMINKHECIERKYILSL